MPATLLEYYYNLLWENQDTEGNRRISGKIEFERYGRNITAIATVDGFPNNLSETISNEYLYSTPTEVMADDILSLINIKIQSTFEISGEVIIDGELQNPPEPYKATPTVSDPNPPKPQTEEEKALTTEEPSPPSINPPTPVPPPKFSVPAGIGLSALILGLIKTSIKSTVKVEPEIQKYIDKLKEQCPPSDELKKIVKIKNQFTNPLNIMATGLSTFTKTTTSVEKVLSTIEKVVFVLKFLPIPTSIPPGIGITVGVINGFTFLIETLGGLISKDKTLLDQCKNAFSLIEYNIATVKNQLTELDAYLSACINEKLKISEAGGEGGMTQEEVNELMINLNTVSQNSSNEIDDVKAGKKLLDSLNPNSTNPLIYKGFQISLQPDKDNTLSLPRRRLKAINVIYRFELVGDYSFSSSTEILVEEIKFKIDQYIAEQGETPPPFPTDIPSPTIVEEEEEEEIIDVPLGFYWKYTDTELFYYTDLEGVTEIFQNETDYFAHREMNNLPKDLSQVQYRGPDPEKAAEAAQAIADAAAAEAQAAADAAAAEALQENYKEAIQAKISSDQSKINDIKARLRDAISRVSFNKNNRSRWNNRVNNDPGRWWYDSYTDDGGYDRIRNKYNPIYGSTINDLAKWKALEKNISNNNAAIKDGPPYRSTPY